MPQPSGVKKHLIAPDQFVDPYFLVKFRCAYKNAPNAGLRANYGHFYDFGARRGVVAILDGKVTVNDKAVGEFSDYLTIATKNDSEGYIEVRGMVYDPEKYYLMVATQQRIMKTVEGNWVDGGSVAVVQEFFEKCYLDNKFDEALLAVQKRLQAKVLL